MPSIEAISDHVVYENPEPQLRARHAYFPGLVPLPSGDLLAFFMLGEAMNATNATTMVSRSTDGGQAWHWVAREGSNADIPPLHLYDVGAPGQNGRLVLTGMNGIELDTNDSGASWNPVETPEGLYTWINAIAFGDDGKGVLVGGKGAIMTTSDSGKSWQLVGQEEESAEEPAEH